MSSWSQRARSFGSQAERYDRVRPAYPPAALDAVLPDAASTVVDVGAGTGKLTAGLVERGLRVVAVEPDEAMRAVLARQVPGADLRAGTAEALPVEDASVDAVVFGQSWHWADRGVAAAEAARVLRPGGTLGQLWNVDDDNVDWVAELRSITASTANFTDMGQPAPLDGFGEGRRVDVNWPHVLSRADLVELTSTWSAVSVLAHADRAPVLERVDRLLREHPAVAGADPVAVPQICVTFTYVRQA